jgi:hypothetical protein
MFAVDKSTGLEEINAWPALMIMSSFVWLVVAGLLGLVMPATQIFDLELGPLLHHADAARRGADLPLLVPADDGRRPAPLRRLRRQGHHRLAAGAVPG